MTQPHVLLVVPPGPPGATPNREGASGLGALVPRPDAFRYPPHTCLTVASHLKANGHTVAALDAAADGWSVEQAVERVAGSSSRVVGVYVSWATGATDAAFIARLRATLSADVQIVAFGISAGWICESLTGADHVLLGEPELAFSELCDRLVGSERLPREVATQSLMPAAYDDAGRIIDPDSVLPPAWELLSPDKYPFLSVLSSRGCEERCHWCPYVVAQGRSFRSCTPGRVVEEIRAGVEQFAPKRIVFRDPAFAHDRGRVAEICRLIRSDAYLSPGRNLLWECESHPAHLVGLVPVMSLAGCVGIKFGIETASRAMIRQYGRAESPDGYMASIRDLVTQCRRYGIASRAYAMGGLPGETDKSLKETADFVRAVGPTSLTIKTFKRYPGLEGMKAMAAELAVDTAPLRQVQATLSDRRGPIVPPWRCRLARVLARARARLSDGA